jgi:hypothetical protein
VYPVPLTVLR